MDWFLIIEVFVVLAAAVVYMTAMLRLNRRPEDPESPE